MEIVLVVDQSADVRASIRSQLRTLYPQLRIMEARNGKEGIMLAVMEQPDLIMMGAEMPIMNGYEAAYKLQTMPRTQAIPLIAIDNQAASIAVMGGLQRFAHGVLPESASSPEFRHVLLGIMARVARERPVVH